MLYLVPSPIGNLKDISFRAIEVLKEVDLVLAEDTRTTGKLLSHYSIETKLSSFHMHNEHKRAAGIVSEMQQGMKMALVSDAGSPGISDPGFLLVRACVEAEIEIIALPGPTALIPALAASGLPCDRFVFEGFLPQKKGRQKRVTALQSETRTMVFYESPHRLSKCLEQFIAHFGPDRKACVAREISKIYESYHRGTLAELLTLSQEETLKGEMVIIVAGA